jgi:chemotaxis protein MotB
VSLSKYNDRVAEVGALKGNVASLEDKLKQSEATGKMLDTELQQYKEGIAKLLEQHEGIKTESVATSTGSEADKMALGNRKRSFASDMEALDARLSASAAKIKELSAALAAQKEAANAESQEQRIKALNDTIRSQEAQIEQLKNEVAELSRKRSISSEKENAVEAVRADLSQEITKGEVVVTELRDKMIVVMNEMVLFDSGSAAITRNGSKVLDRVARILKKVKNNQVRIEGHTDSATIGAKIINKFPSNWDLAAARATSVVKYLESKGKLDPKLLAIAGYGPHQPLAENDTEKGRKMNRRIEIALVPVDNDRPAPVKLKPSAK